MEVKGVAKNPLAIIALFISFMYGSASLILGTSIDKLDGFNKNALILFLILFPILIFGAFFYLVVNHHAKLYAPGDYRSDESFLAGVESVSGRIQLLGAELDLELEEAETEEAEEAAPPLDEGAVERSPSAPTEPAVTSPVPASARNALLAQSLTADLFQKRLGGLLKRDVQFVAKNGQRFVFDFAIEVKDTVYVGEVKYTRRGSLERLVNSLIGHFSNFKAAHIADNIRFIQLGVIVFEDRPEFGMTSVQHPNIFTQLKQLEQQRFDPDLTIEGLTMSELLQGGEALSNSVSTTPT